MSTVKKIIQEAINKCDAGRKLEIELEMKIAIKAIEGLVKAGYQVAVDNGEEQFKPSAKINEVAKDLFQCDEEYLIAFKDGKQFGWVFLVWGNVGALVSDYSINLESALKDANDYADQYN